MGAGPVGLTYDSGHGDVFVANQLGGSVSVVSDTTNIPVAIVTVGSFPSGLAYDPTDGEVFVSNWGGTSNSVSVINDTSNTVVATIAVMNNPLGLAYDSGRGEVFVANSNSNTLSVISTATNMLVDVIPIATPCQGSNPTGVAYDPMLGEIFVTDNGGGGNVCVISDATNLPIANVPVGASPEGVAFDNATNDVWVADSGSGTVEPISASGNVAGVPVATGPSPVSIAFDPSNGYLFVGDPGGAQPTMTVVDGATGSVLSSTSIGGSGWLSDIAYDSGMSEVFVANANANTVSVLPSGNTASATFTVTGSLLLSPVNGPSGTVVAARGSGFLPSAHVSFTFRGTGVASTCTTNSSGSFTPTGSTCIFTVPSASAGGATVGATDGTYSASATFTLTAATVALSPSSGPTNSLVGVSGTGYAPSTGYTYCFSGSSSAACSSGRSFESTSGGSIPPGTTISVPTSGNGWLDVSETPSNFITSGPFSVMTAALALSPSSGPLGTVVTLSGSGYAPTTTYDYCASSSSGTTCGSGLTFTSSGTGSIPSGTTLVVSAGSTGYVDLSQGSTNFILSAPFTVTPVTLSLTPSSGPPGSLVTLSGSGYTPSTSYRYCYSASSGATCPIGTSFTSTAGGAIPLGTTITAPSTSNAYVEVSLGSTIPLVSAAFTATAATLAVNPNSGLPGDSLSLNGAGFAPTTLYLYCLQASRSSACPTGTSTSFTSTAGGVVPSGTTLTAPTLPAGSYHVDISQGSATANFIVGAAVSILGTLTLSPASGMVGNLTSAAGSGFANLSAVTLVWDPGSTTPVTLSCVSGSLTTSSTGSFSCTFQVPTAPVGAHAIEATVGSGTGSAAFSVSTTFGVIGTVNPTFSEWANVDNVSTGDSPIGVAFDYGTNELFVANSATNNVTVFGVTPRYCIGPGVALQDCENYTFHADVNVLNGPEGLAYDPAKGEVFVADERSAGFSVISDSSLSVTNPHPSGWSSPYAVAYDPRAGDVLFTDPTGHQVYVVNDSNPTTSPTTIGLGAVSARPEGVVYDSGNQEIYVADSSSPSFVYAMNATTQVVMPIPITGGAPWGLAYDSGKREIFVTQLTGYVSIIDDRTNAPPTTAIFVGGTPEWATYDNNASMVFVSTDIPTCLPDSKNTPGRVVTIDDSTNGTVDSLSAGVPEGLAYDSLTGEVWVADACYNRAIAFSANWNEPLTLAYDPTDSKLFVTNGNDPGESVSVVSDAAGSLDGVVSTGCCFWSEGAVYDPGTGLVYISDLGSVSVVDASTDSTVGSIVLVPSPNPPYFVLTDPGGVAYDPAQGEIFTTYTIYSTGASYVAVIDDSTGSIATTLGGVGDFGNPNDIVYDPGTGDVFVLTSHGNAYSVIDGSTDVVLATVSFGSGAICSSLAYDPTASEIFAMCGTDMVAISDGTLGLASSLTDVPGAYDLIGMTYDSGRNALLISGIAADGAHTAIFVVSPITLGVAASIPLYWLGSGGIVYDQGTGQAFVANGWSGTLSVLSA